IHSAQAERIEVVSTRPRMVVFGGIGAIILIIATVFAGLYVNNRVNAPTATLPATVVVPTVESVVTEPSEIPATTQANTEVPSITSTPFMAESSPTILLSNTNAVGTGFGESLSETIANVLSYDAPFVPLRTQPNFYVEITLAEAASGY